MSEKEKRILKILIEKEIQHYEDVFTRTNNVYWLEKIEELKTIKLKL